MSTKIGINGFGDIGKLVARFLLEYNANDIEITRINTNSSTIESHAKRFNTDTGYQFNLIPRTLLPYAKVEEGKLCIAHPNGRKFTIECSNTKLPEDIDWEDCDVIIDSSGKYRTKNTLEAHRNKNPNLSHIILTCPPKDTQIALFTFGVNSNNFNFESEKIISNGSCSGNCATPILKLINDRFSIEEGALSGIHCNTNSEYINDSYHPTEENRGRASFMNTKSISTGLAISLFGLLPELKEKIDPHVSNFRVSSSGSLVNFRLKVKHEITKENLVKAVQSSNYFPTVISINHEQMTSKDVIGNQSSSVICIPQIHIWNNTISMTAYYDNRMAYSRRTCELVKKIHHHESSKHLNAMASKIMRNK